MANTYKPIEETTFTDNKPIPGAMLKQIYDNIEQVDENQRKIQVNKVWNAGRTIFTNTDTASETLPDGGTLITTAGIAGYRTPDNSATAVDSKFLQIYPFDLYGHIIAVPFWLTRTSNQIKITISCQVLTSPIVVSVGYSVDLIGEGGAVGPFPEPGLNYGRADGFSSDFYNTAPAAFSYDQIDPRDYNSSLINRNTKKYIPISGATDTKMLTFILDNIDFDSEGPSIVYINILPTWVPIANFEAINFTLYTDELNRVEHNIVKVKVDKIVGIDYESLNILPTAGDQTGNKIPFGLEIYHVTDTSKKFYYGLVEYMPWLDTATNTWDVNGTDFMVYPRLNEEIVANPSDFRINFYQTSQVNMFAVNVRELYVP
jgi:hypothetical protein